MIFIIKIKKLKMRNHKLVHNVVDKMLLYNHSLYIDDINQLIQSRQFNNNINYYLNQIISVLHGVLQTQNQYNVQNTSIVQSLKTCVFYILDNDGGMECCNKLLCSNQ